MKGDKNYDYTDEFSDIIHTERFISAVELSELFFSAPKWITLLMKFRNVVMRPFGLKKERKLSDWCISNPRIWRRYAKMINILIWKLCL